MSARDSLERFIRWVMRDVTYLRNYTARVVLDHGDQTFDIGPEESEAGSLAFVPSISVMPRSGLSHVPVAHAIAGTTIGVEQGTRCLFGFENGDPKRPVIRAFAFQTGSSSTSFFRGTGGFARQGDHVRALIGSAPKPGVVGGTLTIPGSPPQVIDVPAGSSVVLMTASTLDTDDVHGTIIGGARRVLN